MPSWCFLNASSLLAHAPLCLVCLAGLKLVCIAVRVFIRPIYRSVSCNRAGLAHSLARYSRSDSAVASPGSQDSAPSNYCLVTGASTGIGRAYAVALAEAGFNLIVVARRTAELERLREEVHRSKPECDVVIVSADLATDEGIRAVTEAAKGRDLCMLVNNAGLGNVVPDSFTSQTLAAAHQMLTLNNRATVDLTWNLLEKLKNRGSAAIIFMGSSNGIYPCPRHAVYSGTKSFVHGFTQALWRELRGTGVDIYTFAPFWVSTDMTCTSKETLLFLSPQGFVNRALGFVAAGRHSPQPIVPYYWHGVLAELFSLLPTCLRLRFQDGFVLGARPKIIHKLEKARALAREGAPAAGAERPCEPGMEPAAQLEAPRGSRGEQE